MKSSDIILYTTAEGKVKIDIWFEDETFWLSQKKMSDLFGMEVNTINYHLKEIFKTGELETDGKSYLTNHYNLDAIFLSQDKRRRKSFNPVPMQNYLIWG